MIKILFALLLSVTSASAQFINGGGGGSGGSGTVTSLSVVTANGFAGSVATATTTPAITLTTTVTGNVCSNATALSACTTTGTGSTVLATSPTFTGTPIIPTPFTLGAISVTSTGTQLNYLSAATGTTGTTSTNVVFSTSPTLTTPVLGVAIGTSLALGGATIGSNAIAVTGTSALAGQITNALGTITTSQPATFTQTWNAAGVTFIGSLLNITATAKATGSKLFDVQASGVSQLAAIWDGGGYVIRSPYYYDSSVGYYIADGATASFGTSGPKLASSGSVRWSSTTNANIAEDSTFSRQSGGVLQFGTTTSNALGSWLAVNGTLSGALVVSGTADASAVTGSGALQVAGGASIAKRVWIPAITTSAGLQQAVLCQSSGGEMIADSVACLASSVRFKTLLGVVEVGAIDKLIRLTIHRWKYKEEGIFKSDDWTRERIGPTAEDVEAVDPRLVGYDYEGKPRNISTEQLLALAIQAIQEQQMQIEKLNMKLQ